MHADCKVMLIACFFSKMDGTLAPVYTYFFVFEGYAKEDDVICRRFSGVAEREDSE